MNSFYLIEPQINLHQTGLAVQLMLPWLSALVETEPALYVRMFSGTAVL